MHVVLVDDAKIFTLYNSVITLTVTVLKSTFTTLFFI